MPQIPFLNQLGQSPMSQMDLAKPAAGQVMSMPQTQVGNAQQAPMTPSLATPQQEAQMQTPIGQQKMGALGGEFDMAGMASALGKAAQAQAGKQRQQMAQMQTTPGQQIPMPGQMPQMPAAPQAPQGPSIAMQTIQGFQQSPLGGGMIGGQPTRQQMMQRLQGR